MKTYVALIALLALTIGLSYVPMGPFNFVVAFAIASAKALLVIFFFMHLKKDIPLSWIYACVGVVWLLIGVMLTFSDYLTRQR